MEALTERQKKLIVGNVVKACKDIRKLNKTGYNFLHMAGGFIAHHDLSGFISYYEDYNLRLDIIANARNNVYSNFFPNERNYEYYKSKADVYQRILSLI